MPDSIIATGTTIAFGTSSFAVNIDTIEVGDRVREAINMSHMGTSSDHIFVPADLVDNGELVINGHLDYEVDPPIDGAAETITISWPLKSGQTTKATWAFSGFMTNYRASAPKEDKATCTATIKISGGLTITAGS